MTERTAQMDEILARLKGKPKVDEKEAELAIAAQKLQENVRADIEWLMEHKKVSRKELANRLGISAPAVSKMLNKPNLTLKTIARIFKALDERCDLNSPTLEYLRLAAKLGKSVDTLVLEYRGEREAEIPCEIYDFRSAFRQKHTQWRNTTVNDNSHSVDSDLDIEVTLVAHGQ